MELTIDNIKGLSYSIVFIWKTPLNSLPPLRQEFAESIFENTPAGKYSLGRNGISVVFPTELKQVEGGLTPLITPMFQMGFDRMVITNADLNVVNKAYARLESEIKRLNFQNSLLIGQMGINIEYEVSFNEGKVQNYINNRFNTPHVNEKFVISVINEVKLTLVESKEEMKLVNITIQPRTTSDQAFFLKMNDHFSKMNSQIFLTPSELSNYFSSSEEKFSTSILPYLNLFNNGK